MGNQVYLKFIFLVLLLGHGFSGISQNTGEIMFVGFDADVEDGFAIVTLVDLPASTVLFFSDRAYDGAVFTSAEGTITWNSGGSIISAGTVITFTGMQSSASRTVDVGSITAAAGSFNLSTTSETLLLYSGTDEDTPTTFISGIANNVTTDLTNAGLTDGTNAINLGSSADVGVYNISAGTDCNSTVAACAAMLADTGNWTTEGGSGDQSNDGSGIDYPTNVPPSFGGSALPVELLSFEGKSANGNIVLSWTTASEVNNDHFKLSRSADGKTFTDIGFVEGNGTTSAGASYSYTDRYISYQVVYYRLTQVDFDGSREDFPLIAVLPSPLVARTQVYPNPTAGTLKVVSDQIIKGIAVTDISGKLLFQSTETKVDLSAFRNGNYLLMVDYGSNREVLRISKAGL
ncbi:MAG: T9SS type A sorting domain-containing protein [Bacteroidota bacterium]